MRKRRHYKRWRRWLPWLIEATRLIGPSLLGVEIHPRAHPGTQALLGVEIDPHQVGAQRADGCGGWRDIADFAGKNRVGNAVQMDLRCLAHLHAADIDIADLDLDAQLADIDELDRRLAAGCAGVAGVDVDGGYDAVEGRADL